MAEWEFFSSSCLGFQPGVRDFRWEQAYCYMVGTSMENIGEYGGRHGEYQGSFNVDIHGGNNGI